jgi:hypothetical protein
MSETKPDNTIEVDLKGIFNSQNTVTVIWFLAVYFFILVVLAIFFKDKLASAQALSEQIVDILVFGTLAYYSLYVYYENKDQTLEDYLKRELEDLNTTIYFGIFAIGLTGVMYAYKLLTMSNNAPFSLAFLSSVSWIYLSVILIFNFFKYVLQISLLDIIFSSSNNEPETVVETDDVSDEVFNISNNLYTFDDAKSVCGSYGARLANYDEIENAYNNGAEWCNYGWSEGQMAFFPTQKDTWSVLQRNKKHANDCGRPGVNGGYMGNPYIKFGVNCFGKKPIASEADLFRMNAKKNQLTPAIKDGTLTKEWEDATISSFNKEKWSLYKTPNLEKLPTE